MSDRTEADYFTLVAQRRGDLRTVLAELLAGKAEIVLEIGSGHGHFLNAYAAKHPDRFCLGIDIVPERIRRATKKRDRARLGNLAFVRAEAEEMLLELPSSVLVGDTFVLFPDPWPKRRHVKNRLIKPEFLSLLAQRTRPGGGLYLRTDHQPYFLEARSTVEAHADWRIDGESAWPFEHETVFQARAPSYSSLIARGRRAPA